MLQDSNQKRNIHLFTITQKAEMQAVLQWATPPYGVVSAPYLPHHLDLYWFDKMTARTALKIFDCGASKAPILQIKPHHIRHFIYQGTTSEALTQLASHKNYQLLDARPPAMIFSAIQQDWQAQISDWQVEAHQYAVAMPLSDSESPSE